MSTTVFEVNTDFEGARRFPGWIALSVFSVVCLAALSAQFDDTGERDGEVKWSLSICSISFMISLASSLAYIFSRGLFSGQLPEGLMVLVCLAFWGVGLPIIHNPAHQIASSEIGVKNANLFFFSWMSFACIIFLFGHLVQEFMGIDIQSVTAEKTPRWFALSASSLVVMGSSIRIFSDICDSDAEAVTGSTYCVRCKLALSIGVLSFLVAASMTAVTQVGVSDFLIELAVSMLLFIIWCFGVGFITFGDSPGVVIGNLYFSSWISFIIVLFLFGSAVTEIMFGASAPPPDQTATTDDGTTPDGNPDPTFVVSDDNPATSPTTNSDFGESYGDASFGEQQQQSQDAYGK